MKITNQQELDKLIATADKTNTIILDEDLEITFDCEIPGSIKVYGDIDAWKIKAYGDIDARNIDAHNIIAGNIDARNIDAGNINAGNIKAYNIIARNIKYYSFCIAYQSLKCESILGRRQNSFHKCLDQAIEIIKEEKKVIIELTQSQIDKIKHLI
jgi:hypothetical protein